MAADTRDERDGHAVEERHQLHMASIQLAGHGQYRDRGQVQTQSEYLSTYQPSSHQPRATSVACPCVSMTAWPLSENQSLQL